eukprot:jgi/Undpi1/4753/HiC_scaffold_18.g08106.m1
MSVPGPVAMLNARRGNGKDSSGTSPDEIVGSVGSSSSRPVSDLRVSGEVRVRMGGAGERLYGERGTPEEAASCASRRFNRGGGAGSGYGGGSASGGNSADLAGEVDGDTDEDEVLFGEALCGQAFSDQVQQPVPSRRALVPARCSPSASPEQRMASETVAAAATEPAIESGTSALERSTALPLGLGSALRDRNGVSPSRDGVGAALDGGSVLLNGSLGKYAPTSHDSLTSSVDLKVSSSNRLDLSVSSEEWWAAREAAYVLTPEEKAAYEAEDAEIQAALDAERAEREAENAAYEAKMAKLMANVAMLRKRRDDRYEEFLRMHKEAERKAEMRQANWEERHRKWAEQFFADRASADLTDDDCALDTPYTDGANASLAPLLRPPESDVAEPPQGAQGAAAAVAV